VADNILNGCRVLVVDDSPFALELSKALLEKAGCTDLSGADGGREALGLAEAAHFDVVLLDVTMPDMSGYAVARRLRLIPPTPGAEHGPVIVMLTGRDIAEVEPEALMAGADAVMAKPIDRCRLLALLEQLLERRRAAVV
jgi:CheY-like chemotaxis protein